MNMATPTPGEQAPTVVSIMFSFLLLFWVQTIQTLDTHIIFYPQVT